MGTYITFSTTNDRELYGINLVVFSKDRAMQLEALLSSIRTNAKKMFSQISIVYKASPDHKYSYDLLKEKHPYINWIEETDFYANICDAINTEDAFILFLTDDDIVFEKISKRPLKYMNKNRACFSFRLGSNIDYCYSNDLPNKLGVHGQLNELLLWDWSQQELDFAYPLSVTAHLFYTDMIKRMVGKCYFQSPNVMEGKLQGFLRDFPKEMFSYTNSRIVGIPANRVNNDCPNRSGLSYPYSTQELLDLFMIGKRINWKAMDWSNIHAAQQEVAYVFSPS